MSLEKLTGNWNYLSTYLLAVNMVECQFRKYSHFTTAFRHTGFRQLKNPHSPKRMRVSEASTRIELVIEVLQTFALPLGYDAIFK